MILGLDYFGYFTSIFEYLNLIPLLYSRKNGIIFHNYLKTYKFENLPYFDLKKMDNMYRNQRKQPNF